MVWHVLCLLQIKDERRQGKARKMPGWMLGLRLIPTSRGIYGSRATTASEKAVNEDGLSSAVQPGSGLRDGRESCWSDLLAKIWRRRKELGPGPVLVRRKRSRRSNRTEKKIFGGEVMEGEDRGYREREGGEAPAEPVG